jgi:outer membrane lipoprotein
MYKKLLMISVMLLLASCAPVLNKSMMQRGIYLYDLSEIKQDPAQNKGEIFILGGIIVKTDATKEGSLIEAIFVPVDSSGYLKTRNTSVTGRFLALYRDRELLDPLLYSEKREITLAGEYVGIRKGKIGELDYSYPLFEIRDIHLWDEISERDRYYYRYYRPYYYPYPPYYYRHYRPGFYDPWWHYY